MNYDLELEKAAGEIIARGSKVVCIQLPEGLKQKAIQIVDYLTEHTDADILIWAESCFGACDIPDLKDVDLLIQWGHSEWKATSKKG
ncbi:MAG: diphthamide synthesis protein [Nanoarchaeota archaeon]|nr:diphthamide synthesis protein [Nanoarchaeota archaeon]MCG2717281.1 diphthamide synthesis protein [Nanoarchaeota archaeon]